MGRKHCGKRRNCSLRAISPFPTVFCKRLVSQGRQKVSLCGNELNHYHTMPLLMHLTYLALENIVRKGEIANNKQFLLFSQCFLPSMPLIFHFKSTLKCCLQFVSIWTSLKFCRLVMG